MKYRITATVLGGSVLYAISSILDYPHCTAVQDGGDLARGRDVPNSAGFS